MFIRCGTVSVFGIVHGFPPMIVDNRGSFVARKKSVSIQLNTFPDIKVCDSGLSYWPMPTAFLKFSLGIKYITEFQKF